MDYFFLFLLLNKRFGKLQTRLKTLFTTSFLLMCEISHDFLSTLILNLKKTIIRIFFKTSFSFFNHECWSNSFIFQESRSVARVGIGWQITLPRYYENILATPLQESKVSIYVAVVIIVQCHPTNVLWIH